MKKTLEYFVFDLMPRFLTKEFSTYLFRYLKSPFQGNNSKKITTRETIMRIEKLNERKITSLLNKISSVDMIIILEWSEPNAFHTLWNHAPYSIRATHLSTYVISLHHSIENNKNTKVNWQHRSIKWVLYQKHLVIKCDKIGALN